MSKFFDRSAGQDDSPAGGHVERWLEEIQKTVGDQVSGVTVSLEPKPAVVRASSGAEPALSGAASATVVLGGGSLTAASFERVELPRAIERVLALASTAADEPASEAYRVLRTRLLRRNAVTGTQSIAITSSVKGEGKTLTTLNLALYCAQVHGVKVLLVDADLRSAGMSSLLNLPESAGLAQALEGSIPYEAAIKATSFPNFHVMPAGYSPLHAPELFSGSGLRHLLDWCRDKFKLVLIDCPPIIGLSDAELIASASDAIIIIARARETHPELLKKSVSQLDGKKLMGVVMNSGDENKHSYYYTYGYGNRKGEAGHD